MIQLQAKIVRALGRPAAPSSDFDLNPGLVGHLVPTRESGVLVPLIERPSGMHLVLTKRAAHLAVHPGQIAFPGGKRDLNDVNVVATALREAYEEIGLNPELVNVLGQLPVHDTVTGFKVTPTIGWISQPWHIVTAPGEVSEVFEVPLCHVLKLRNFRIQTRILNGQNRAYYSVPYGPYYIWGATARILHGFAEQMSAL